MRGADIGEGDVCALAVESGAGVPVVEDVLGKIGVDRRGVFGGHGADEEGIAVEELQVCREGVFVLGVEVEEGLEEGLAGLRLAVEGCVDVVEELVADCDGLLCGLGDAVPVVVLLWDAADFVVVAGEGVEGAEGGPAGTELFCRVEAEAADVGSYHGDLEHRGKGEDLGNGVAVLVP